jgi:hypothetical protein
MAGGSGSRICSGSVRFRSSVRLHKTVHGAVKTVLAQRKPRLALPITGQDVPHTCSQGKGIRHCARPWIWHLRYVLRCKLYPVKQGIARLLTSYCIWASLGIAELLIFHPVDTIAKRLMSNKAKVFFIFTLAYRGPQLDMVGLARDAPINYLP